MMRRTAFIAPLICIFLVTNANAQSKVAAAGFYIGAAQALDALRTTKCRSVFQTSTQGRIALASTEGEKATLKKILPSLTPGERAELGQIRTTGRRLAEERVTATVEQALRLNGLSGVDAVASCHVLLGSHQTAFILAAQQWDDVAVRR